MAGATFTIPLLTVIPGQLITASLWNNEWNNLANNLNPSGLDGYSDTDTQMQLQTNPYPGSVTSHATSLGGETERVRYQISQITGLPFWYQLPAVSLATVPSIVVPIGGIIDFVAGTPPSINFARANGQAISRTAYPAAFALMGVAFGAGDGSNTFNLPNLTDRVSIGAGNLYTDGQTGGVVTPTLTDPGHNHTQNAHTHTDSGHSHSTPNHIHELDYTVVGSLPGSHNPISPALYTADADGTDAEFVTPSTGANANYRRHKSGTQSGGGSTTGTGNAALSSDTATNNSNTTGITIGQTLPPFIGLYKMIRIL